MSPDPTVKQQIYASGLRHGEHHYGVEVFLSARLERLEAIFDQRKRHAQYLLILRGTVMTRQDTGASPVRAFENRVQHNQGD